MADIDLSKELANRLAKKQQKESDFAQNVVEDDGTDISNLLNFNNGNAEGISDASSLNKEDDVVPKEGSNLAQGSNEDFAKNNEDFGEDDDDISAESNEDFSGNEDDLAKVKGDVSDDIDDDVNVTDLVEDDSEPNDILADHGYYDGEDEDDDLEPNEDDDAVTNLVEDDSDSDLVDDSDVEHADSIIDDDLGESEGEDFNKNDDDLYTKNVEDLEANATNGTDEDDDDFSEDDGSYNLEDSVNNLDALGDDDGKLNKKVNETGIGEEVKTAEAKPSKVDNFVASAKQRLADIKAKMGLTNDVQIASKGSQITFEDTNGKVLEPRYYDKRVTLEAIDRDKIKLSTPIRAEGTFDSGELQESIKELGLLEPLLVMPVGEPMVEETTLPDGTVKQKLTYRNYLLIHGFLRYDACVHLNIPKIPCIVDATIPPELRNAYMAVYNQSQPYKFSEKLARAQVLRDQFPSDAVTATQIEKFAGYAPGDWYKAQYIDSMKLDYPQFYNEVESGKSTIKQAFDKIEKDINKKEKAELDAKNAEGNEQLNADDVDDILRDKNKDELQEIQNEVNRQTLGERKPLATELRRQVEISCNGTCLICGFPWREKKDAKGQIVFGEDGKPVMVKDEDLSSRQEVEHLLGVHIGGPDDPKNLYIICQRCHAYLENYYNDKYTPSQETYDSNEWVRRMVIAGNIKKKAKQHAIAYLKKTSPATYKKVADGKLTIGRGLLKAKSKFDPMTVFDGNPLKVLKDEIKKLDEGNADGYSDLNYMGDDLGEVQELKNPNQAVTLKK